ncbi:putative BAH domain-containing protein [Helianthus annuus]|nr:putative BAH domain-containing protein [Helianthus annuus]KAJ0497527.1 putative BAH domain-containing protein [Helianthus annuus]KAJ0663543.1 putative BAH domain-containing protein [Helianthus annuus]KAJ0671036.1 putative BAH domain-containing protein [Helianthus annuus]
MMAKVIWYYQPEDVEDGRRLFHGESEVSRNHFDLQSTEVIQGRCGYTSQKYIKHTNESQSTTAKFLSFS